MRAMSPERATRAIMPSATFPSFIISFTAFFSSSAIAVSVQESIPQLSPKPGFAAVWLNALQPQLRLPRLQDNQKHYVDRDDCKQRAKKCLCRRQRNMRHVTGRIKSDDACNDGDKPS